MYDDFPIGSFKSYIWNKHDVIGAGATSLVYKAICQESGDTFAVKVFNDAAKSRSNVLQLRELELLHKINHENVVKLIDKDDQVTSVLSRLYFYSNFKFISKCNMNR
jgi:serine/threonine protein kinase